MEAQNQKAPIFGFLAFLFSFLAAFLFFNVGLSTNDFFSFSFSGKIAKILSVNFALFLLSVPLLGVLASAASFWIEKKIAWLSLGIGSAVGLGLSVVVFPSLADFFWVGVFFVIGVLVSIQQVYMKKDELKHWITFRLAKIGVQRHLALVAVGLILFSAATILPQKSMFAEKFENDLADTIFSGNSTGNLKTQLSDSLAETSVQSQRQLLNQLVLLPQYTALRDDMQNTKTQAFVSVMGQLQSTVNSDSYKKTIQDQIEQQTAGVTVNPAEVFNKVKENFPLFTAFGEWLWLIFGVGLASMFLFFSSFILAPLGMVYGFLLNKIFKTAWKPQAVSASPQAVFAAPLAAPETPKPVSPAYSSSISPDEMQKLKDELKKQLEQSRPI
ncbi:MAG: hypothetical protein V1777_01630 [Candidatus Micrarchaeota archaeon]